MITALLLIFDPSGTWEKIGSTPKHRVWQIFLSYLLPLLFLSIAVESFGLMKLGMNEGGLLSRVVKPSQDLVVRYEAVQVLIDLLIIFGGTWLLKQVGEGFHRRHTYSECFATLGYSLGPLYLFRMLDALPAINTWLCYGVGILLVVAALYRGVARVMKPDPSNALGVYLMASLVMIAITGIGHYLAVLVLDEKILVIH
jgi:hypothetical protein